MKIHPWLAPDALARTMLCAALVVSSAAARAAEDTVDDQFKVVSDYDAFESAFIGPKISDPANHENFFVIKGDGSIEGTWHGAALAGRWRWEDGYFCRSLSAPRAAPEDCQEWSVAGDRARLARERGAGESTDYVIVE